MASVLHSIFFSILFVPLVFATGPQKCYFGPGADHRAPAEVVPCVDTGESACCLSGDTCLSGNTCYNYASGNLYQYGCTDITYTNEVCPYKCGWNATLSPWTALEYCEDDKWVCHAPESCGCIWEPNYDMVILAQRACKDMGSDARVAFYGPSEIAPYVSLPGPTNNGSTGYYSPITVSGTSSWVQTAVANYTPTSVTPLTTYSPPAPTQVVLIYPNKDPSASTAASASPVSSTAIPSGATVAATASTTSNSTAPAATSASSDGTLSTGAKAGIGVGAAGGACGLIALIVAFFLWRRRKSQPQQQQQPQQDQHQHMPPPGYPSPPMQEVQPYYSPGPMQGWQGQYPQQHMQGGYFHQDTSQMGINYPGSPPGMYGEQKKPPFSPPSSPPMELSAERRVHELGSELSDGPHTSPPPLNAETEGTRRT